MKNIKDFLISVEDFLELERDSSYNNTYMYVVGFLCVIILILDRMLDEKYPLFIEYLLSIYNQFMTQQLDNQLFWIIYSILLILLVVCTLHFLLLTTIISFKKFFLLMKFIIKKIK
jgi:hypothetical protein